MNFIDLLCGKTGTPSTVIYPAVHQPNVEEICVQKQHLTHHKRILCVSDLPRWRPLPSQWSNKAAPQPVPGELLRGMLQATRNSVWGSAGGGEWRRGLVWPPDAHVPPKVFPAHKFCQTLTSIPSPCPSTTLAYKLSTIRSSHLFSLNSIFAFGLPVSACRTWDCLSSRRQIHTSLTSNPKRPSGEPAKADDLTFGILI